MKKLMIAAAIVCAAVMAQATTIKWGSGGVVIGESAPEEYIVADNFAIYLFDAGAYDSSAIVSKIASGDFSSLKNAMGNDVVVEGGFEPAVGIPSSIPTKGDVNYFALLFDNANAEKANYVFATTSYTETMPDTGTIYLDYDGDTNIFAMDYSTKENWTKISAVPEPTSGLLLLLGVAGLALRRRRA